MKTACSTILILAIFSIFYRSVLGCDGEKYNKLFGEIDTRPCIRFSEISLSRYAVEKRLFRDLQMGTLQSESIDPSEAVSRWVEAFSGEVALIALAYKHGYDKDERTLSFVGEMARYLLAQKAEEGYLAIVGERYDVPGEEALREAFRESPMANSGSNEAFEKFCRSYIKRHRRNELSAASEKYDRIAIEEIGFSIESDSAKRLSSLLYEYSYIAREIRESWIADESDVTIAEYEINGRKVVLDFAEFAKRFNAQPLRQAVEFPSAVMRYAYEWAIADWIYAKAAAKGLLQDAKFLEDKADYKHRTMVSLMLMDMAQARFGIDEDSARAYFEANRDDLKSIRAAVVDVYLYDSFPAAKAAYASVLSGNYSVLESASEKLPDELVELADERWPVSVRQEIMMARVGSYIGLKKLSGGRLGIIHLKDALREVPMLFEDVKQSIIEQLSRERTDEMRTLLVSEAGNLDVSLSQADFDSLVEIVVCFQSHR